MTGDPKTIFVTVGTTLFESLTDAVTTDGALQWMKRHGYTRLVVQHGKGRKPQLPDDHHGVDIVCYDFKSSLRDDMEKADLVLSHAGAGTVMEALQMNKRLVVVINTRLMNNHQTELANAMGERKHLLVVDEPELLQHTETWDMFETFQPVPKEPGDEYDFPRLLNSFLGFDTKEC